MTRQVTINGIDFKINFKWEPGGGYVADLDSATYGNVMYDGVRCEYVGQAKKTDLGWERSVNDLSIANCEGGKDVYPGRIKQGEQDKFEWHDGRRALAKELWEELAKEVKVLEQDPDFMCQAELEYREWSLFHIQAQRQVSADYVTWADKEIARLQTRIDELKSP